jgi:hypothetical protein
VEAIQVELVLQVLVLVHVLLQVLLLHALDAFEPVPDGLPHHYASLLQVLVLVDSPIQKET